MPELDKKMYALLADRADQAVTALVNAVLLEDCGKDRILKIAQDLQRALQDAEEMYLEAEESGA